MALPITGVPTPAVTQRGISISATEMRELCKAGMGAKCCRYIVAGPGGIVCAKHTELRSTIDNRVAYMTAQADNCEGKHP